MLPSNKILYSSGKNDEFYTPAYAITPLLPYIDKKSIVRCPFDTLGSNFVRLLSDAGFIVEHSHISEGNDFFNYEPKKWDVMVSNPPFTGKAKIFDRALSFGKPFALLMTNVWLNDSAPFRLFKTKYNKQLQLLMFDKRIEFYRPGGTVDKKITFSSSYYCCDFLHRDLKFEYLFKTKDFSYQSPNVLFNI